MIFKSIEDLGIDDNWKIKYSLKKMSIRGWRNLDNKKILLDKDCQGD